MMRPVRSRVSSGISALRALSSSNVRDLVLRVLRFLHGLLAECFGPHVAFEQQAGAAFPLRGRVSPVTLFRRKMPVTLTWRWFWPYIQGMAGGSR